MEFKTVRIPNVDKNLSKMVALCTERMEHCMSELKAAGDNVEEDLDGQFIQYEGGHFSRPIYNCMDKFIDNHKITPIIVEQCLRQMFDGKHNNKELFYYLTELALISSIR